METKSKSYAINNKDVLAKISEAERMVIDAEYKILDQKKKILDAEDNHLALLIELDNTRTNNGGVEDDSVIEIIARAIVSSNAIDDLLKTLNDLEKTLDSRIMVRQNLFKQLIK